MLVLCAITTMGWSQPVSISAEAPGGLLGDPERAIDGDPETALAFGWANGGVTLTLTLDGPRIVEAVRVTAAEGDRIIWLREASVGPDAQHLRPLLGRSVNLETGRGGEITTVALPPSVCKTVALEFGGGGERGAIAEVEVVSREARPERHLLCWANDIERDFLSKLDYLADDLGATDLWLDGIKTGFPQTVPNSGFGPWIDAGAFKAFRKRGLRYWLAEHEAFTFMVRRPEGLTDDRRWETTLRQMREVYTRARELGFRGIVYDAEDYYGVPDDVKERYAEFADHVSPWSFKEGFGPGGMYYHRGRQVGQVIAETHGGPLLQLYEARTYAGRNDCRAGNYWWLKGIHDAGVEVWIATEKTYGAGEGEIEHDAPAHLRSWFVNTADHLAEVYEAYPFAARVLPGFHPWNSRLAEPNYLPRYLDEQLTQAEACAFGCWIYNEGNPHAGDPRNVLDKAFLDELGLSAEEFLEVLRRHTTKR